MPAGAILALVGGIVEDLVGETGLAALIVEVRFRCGATNALLDDWVVELRVGTGEALLQG